MIIVSIGGGLGNQMFQYAYYTKLLALYPDEDIKLDMYNTFSPAHNGYEIEKIFNLQARECSIGEANKLSDYYSLRGKYYNIIKYIYGIRRKYGIHKKSFMQQKDFTEYYDDFLNLKRGNDYFLVGAFANVKYFNGIENKIKQMYCFPKITDDTNIKTKRAIENSNSVSIHIRRGDYVQLGLSMPSLEYYKSAVAYMKEKYGSDLKFFVFTDDAEYAYKTLNYISDLIVVTNNRGDKSYIDMQLMSLCKNNIIANSTFSFWGAYLNNNPLKTVIAPNLPYTGCKNIFKDDDWIVL